MAEPPVPLQSERGREMLKLQLFLKNSYFLCLEVFKATVTLLTPLLLPTPWPPRVEIKVTAMGLETSLSNLECRLHGWPLSTGYQTLTAFAISSCLILTNTPQVQGDAQSFPPSLRSLHVHLSHQAVSSMKAGTCVTTSPVSTAWSCVSLVSGCR